VCPRGVRGGASLLAACDVRAFAYRHGAKRRLSIATAGTGGVMYVYGGGIAKIVSAHVPNTEATAEVTPGTVDNMKLLARGAVDLALATGDVLDDAVRRRAAFARAPATPARAIATLYAQPLHLATFADLGIGRVGDLRGRRVSTGAPGSGTETVALRVLAAAGLDPEPRGPSAAPQLRGVGRGAEGREARRVLRRGGSCLTPRCSTWPASAAAACASCRSTTCCPRCSARSARASTCASRSRPARIPGSTPTCRSVGVNNVLVADERLDAALVREITRALFEHKAELVAVHPAAKELAFRTAVVGSSAPYHPGAVQYYREVGAWSP
jgi:TRAP-type uncharacterized transport system substrate-binding protein